MSILSGFFKTKKYRKTDSGYKLQSEWTSSQTVQMDDGKTLEENLGAVKGITSSLSSTSSNYALSASAGKSLNDSINTLNSAFDSKAPTNHASTGTGYGVGTIEKWGHVKIVNALTQSKYYDGYALSPYQGYLLKKDIDLLNGFGGTGQTGESLRLLGKSDENCVYGNYNFGIYYVSGTETGLPLAEYAGFIVSLRWTTSRIIKVLFLVNSYVYMMSQENDGTVVTSWTRIV